MANFNQNDPVLASHLDRDIDICMDVLAKTRKCSRDSAVGVGLGPPNTFDSLDISQAFFRAV